MEDSKSALDIVKRLHELSMSLEGKIWEVLDCRQQYEDNQALRKENEELKARIELLVNGDAER